jgi:dihydroorotase-like cyclic amidohydrolase
MLAVRGGLVVAPDGAREADILVEDGAISALTAPNEARAPDEIDARGCVVLPGAVDAHVHVGLDYRLMDGTPRLRRPTRTPRAAAGGTRRSSTRAGRGQGLVEPLDAA